MALKILFFGQLKEQLAESELSLEIKGEQSIAQVKALLMAQDDKYRLLEKPNLLTALNQNLVKSDATVQVNDELAFFPPVTGG